MRIGMATDHGGFELKQNLVERLPAAGHDIVDFGAEAMNSTDDYPDYVVPLARAVVAGTVDRGVAVCGSGGGASVCANKIPGVRAALVHASLAGHLGLDNLCWVYDNNQFTIEGNTPISFTEDIASRFVSARALGSKTPPA